jgi:hypothetical protein
MNIYRTFLQKADIEKNYQQLASKWLTGGNPYDEGLF